MKSSGFRKFSGIILAGGKSSRMKTDKAKLPLGNKTLLEIQVEKLIALGCEDVIISGKPLSAPTNLKSSLIHQLTGIDQSSANNQSSDIGRLSDTHQSSTIDRYSDINQISIIDQCPNIDQPSNINQPSDVHPSSISAGSAHIHYIPDLLPDLGPMGGLYSCFPECKYSHAIVISVDVPLLSRDTLAQLLKDHEEHHPDATILSHEGHIEPLIGVYDTCHADLCRELIAEASKANLSPLPDSATPLSSHSQTGSMMSTHPHKKLAIKSLLERLDCRYFDFSGDANELLNCNFPEDFEQLKLIFSQA